MNIDDYVHYWRSPDPGRLCALRTGIDSRVFSDTTCPACIMLADMPPALDDLLAVEVWLAT